VSLFPSVVLEKLPNYLRGIEISTRFAYQKMVIIAAPPGMAAKLVPSSPASRLEKRPRFEIAVAYTQPGATEYDRSAYASSAPTKPTSSAGERPRLRVEALGICHDEALAISHSVEAGELGSVGGMAAAPMESH
jgi:hypothetical protein